MSSYRFSTPFAVRLTGLAFLLLGLAVLVLVALVAALSLPGTTLTVGLAVAGVLLVAGAVGLGLVATRRLAVVRLDEAGYRVRLVRGAGVRQARWAEVEDVVATTVAGTPCVVLRLRDGRTTSVPVAVIEGRTEDFVGDLRGHLDRGHGYRPLRRG